MPDFTPPSFESPKSSRDDPRMGDLLGRSVDRPEDARVVMVGFPSDEGVRINGGRTGASEAPDRIRRFLYRMTPDAAHYDAFADLISQTADLGNLNLCARLEDNQESLGRALGPYLGRGALVIVLGGGHETAFGHFLGYVHGGRPVSILNWDAHLDVRPLKEGHAHSGSPFRQALTHESGRLRQYTAAGVLPQSVSREHLTFIEERGGEVVWRDDLSTARIEGIYSQASEPLMVTFDLDAVDQAYAPGVSAPAAGGMPSALWLHAAREAGRAHGVTSIDVCECNPRLDVDNRTARLAAATIWQFLRGRSEDRA